MTPKHRWAISSLLVLGFGIGLAALLSFAALLGKSTERLQQINQDLYVHPFAVRNAAADLKTALYQMRSSVLMLVLMRMQGDDWQRTMAEIDGFELAAHRNVEIIRRNFLGDMKKVGRIEQAIGEWHGVRARILGEVKRGNFALADELVRSEGSPKFAEIIELADYVQAFAEARAKQFVEEGADEAEAVIAQGRRLASLLVLTFIATGAVVFWRVHFLQDELTRRATSDSLTGIPNRGHFLALVEHQLARARRYGEEFSIAIVDLDFFKRINDSYGHQVGDEVLRQFCAVCRKNLREADVLGRLGGEEFGILMPNCPTSEARLVVERIREAVAATLIKPSETEEVRFTASFGLSPSNRGGDYFDVGRILKMADEALYRAKSTGRNRVVACDS